LNFLYEPGFDPGAPVLGEKELQHLKVLRVQPDEKICITDGRGHLHTSKIIKWEKNRPIIQVEQTVFVDRKKPELHLAVGILQSSERMEWMVEKCTELGVHTISFMITHRCERTKINLSRLESSAVSAMKQSRQAWLPDITGHVKFEDILKTTTASKFIACTEKRNMDHLLNKLNAGHNSLILVGPEGDFTTDELEAAQKNGFGSVGLGGNVLRAETAAISVAHLFQIRQLSNGVSI